MEIDYSSTFKRFDDEELKSYIRLHLENNRKLLRVFSYAVLKDKIPVLERLPSDFDFFQQKEAFEIVCTGLAKGYEDLLDFFLEKGLDVTMTRKSGSTFLSSILRRFPEMRGCFNIIIRLIDLGTPLTSNTKSTKIILEYVVSTNSGELLNRLIIAGLDLHFYHKEIWSSLIAFCTDEYEAHFVGLEKSELAPIIYNMGFPLPHSVAQEHITSSVGGYNSDDVQDLKEGFNPHFYSIREVWKLYGEKGIELEIPYIEEEDESL
jgi:hypothetical protein